MKMFSFLARAKYNPGQPSTSRSMYGFSGGTYISTDSAMQVSAFYSGVIYISTQIAKLPWYVKDGDNKIISPEKNKIAKMLGGKSSKEMNSFRLRLFLTQQAIIYGNGYAEIERDMLGRPVALHPIPSDHVCPIRADDGDLYYRIIGGHPSNSGDDAYLPANDVFHVRNFYTLDGIVGQGVVAYANEVLGIAKGADKFANSLYANGGLPSGVLEAEGSLSEDAIKRLKESWQKNHGGRKVGGTAVLEEGVKYKAITYDPDVMQFLESRKFSVLEIARFLRIPPTKLYDSDTSSYNNIEHANLEVAVDTLDAWARNLEVEADEKLLNGNHGGKRTELDLYAVFRGDMNTRSQYFQRMSQMAAISPNEIREREGMSTYDGGDRYYIASNNYTPVDRQDEVIDSQIKKSEDSNSDDSTKEVDAAVVNYLQKRAK